MSKVTVINRFRGGIVPLGQIEGNMQMLMYAMKVTKKGGCTNVCEGLVNFLSTSDLDVLDFLQSFRNSLFLYFLYNNRLHLIHSCQCKQHTEYIATFISMIIFLVYTRHEAGKNYYNISITNNLCLF